MVGYMHLLGPLPCSHHIHSKYLVGFVSFSVAYLGLGRGDNSLSREIQTFLSPTSNNSSEVDTKMFQSQPRDIISPVCPWSGPGVSSQMGMPKTPPQGDIQDA